MNPRREYGYSELGGSVVEIKKYLARLQTSVVSKAAPRLAASHQKGIASIPNCIFDWLRRRSQR
jgi:hypothetical protein